MENSNQFYKSSHFKKIIMYICTYKKFSKVSKTAFKLYFLSQFQVFRLFKRLLRQLPLLMFRYSQTFHVCLCVQILCQMELSEPINYLKALCARRRTVKSIFARFGFFGLCVFAEIDVWSLLEQRNCQLRSSSDSWTIQHPKSVLDCNHHQKICSPFFPHPLRRVHTWDNRMLEIN